MSQSVIEQVESAYLRAKVPEFRVGDTVDVYQKIVEGNKTRTQVFNGVVIAPQAHRRGEGLRVRDTHRRTR